MTRASQQRRPEPAFVHPFPDETPGVIDVQHVLPPPLLEAFASMKAGREVFFDPVCQRVPGHPEDAADAAPTRSFLAGAEHFFPAFRAIGLFRSQDPNGTAVFAEMLLTAALISSIVHNVCTAAFATLLLNRRDDHVTIFFEYDLVDKKIHLSFRVYHYLKYILLFLEYIPK